MPEIRSCYHRRDAGLELDLSIDEMHAALREEGGLLRADTAADAGLPRTFDGPAGRLNAVHLPMRFSVRSRPVNV